jgi:hypothetical protein
MNAAAEACSASTLEPAWGSRSSTSSRGGARHGHHLRRSIEERVPWTAPRRTASAQRETRPRREHDDSRAGRRPSPRPSPRIFQDITDLERLDELNRAQRAPRGGGRAVGLARARDQEPAGLHPERGRAARERPAVGQGPGAPRAPRADRVGPAEPAPLRVPGLLGAQDGRAREVDWPPGRALPCACSEQHPDLARGRDRLPGRRPIPDSR